VAVIDDDGQRTCGLTSLYSCSPGQVLRPIDNTSLIWPTGNLEDTTAYKELTASSSGNNFLTPDASALLSFGQTTLMPDEQVVYRAAIMFSSSGISEFADIRSGIETLEEGPSNDIDKDCVPIPYDNCPETYNPGQEDSDGDEIGDACDYTCGDANSDQNVNISDAVYIINFTFGGGPAPEPLESADVNCDISVNVSDAVYIINFTFSGGHNPCNPDGIGEPDC